MINQSIIAKLNLLMAEIKEVLARSGYRNVLNFNMAEFVNWLAENTQDQLVCIYNLFSDDLLDLNDEQNLLFIFIDMMKDAIPDDFPCFFQINLMPDNTILFQWVEIENFKYKELALQYRVALAQINEDNKIIKYVFKNN